MNWFVAIEIYRLLKFQQYYLKKNKIKNSQNKFDENLVFNIKRVFSNNYSYLFVT